MKPVIFHNDASAEFRAAVEYYERQRAGLGREFRLVIQAAVERICEDPDSFPRDEATETRFCMVNRFPCSIHISR